MNSKAKTYTLLAIVICIWGYIGYKILSKLNPELPEVANENEIVSFTPKKNVEIDTFSIQTVDRDPFLGTLSFKNTKKTRSKSSNGKKAPPTRSISYKGLIKKQQSKEQIFVIDIDNKQYLLKQSQTVDSVKLIRGNAKSIVVRFNNKTQTITLK